MNAKRWGGAAAVVLTGLVLTACGEDEVVQPPDAGSSPHTAAEAFISAASGEKAEIEWAERVTYSIGGTKVDEFDSAAGTDWLSGCPEGTDEVEGRSCPVSAGSTVAEADSPVVEAELPGKLGCSTYTAADVPDGLSPAVIRPAEKTRDCFSDFAVTLYTDDSGAVEWVDLALSGP